MTDSGSGQRYSAPGLREFARSLLVAAGLTEDKAAAVAWVLVEGDLLGHTTHGLQLLGPYLKELEAGTMTKEGAPEVVSDTGAGLTWDGRYLPGPWLTLAAVEEALERLSSHPVVTVSIRRSHHIASLAAYLSRATDQGYLILLMTSDPGSGASVAPFGGRTPLYTPNPIAAGIPTRNDPILLDVSMSTTTNGMSMRLHREGLKLPGQWLLDARGRVSDDPAVLFTEPPGSILPLGGVDLGHKGFALGLLVEALTCGLGGYGRAGAEKRWGAAVFLQLMDPGAFGGAEGFMGEMTHLALACRAAEPKDPGRPVRLPGQAGLARKRAALKDGLELHPAIMPPLVEWAGRLGVALPKPL